MISTPLLDDFNRADTGPPPSPSWTNLIISADVDGYKVVSNAAQGNGADASGSSDYWNLATYANAEVYLTLTSVLTSGHIQEVWTRIISPGVLNATNGYRIRLTFAGPGLNTWTLSRVDNSIATALATSGFVAQSAGDVLILRSIGAQHSAASLSGGIETMVLAATDETYMNAGFIGMRTNDPNAIVDDFGGGELPDLVGQFPVGYLGRGAGW